MFGYNHSSWTVRKRHSARSKMTNELRLTAFLCLSACTDKFNKILTDWRALSPYFSRRKLFYCSAERDVASAPCALHLTIKNTGVVRIAYAGSSSCTILLSRHGIAKENSRKNKLNIVQHTSNSTLLEMINQLLQENMQKFRQSYSVVALLAVIQRICGVVPQRCSFSYSRSFQTNVSLYNNQRRSLKTGNCCTDQMNSSTQPEASLEK